MNRPNLFNLATSELSQDAFFAWLMSWGDSSNSEETPALHLCAKDFIRMLIGKQYDVILDVSKVRVRRQWKNIDICAEINDSYLIVIEDKTNTTEHSGQLERYAEVAAEGLQLVLIYIKTADFPSSEAHTVERKGYSVIGRKELCDFFNSYHIENDIYNDFVSNLNEIEAASNSYKTLPVGKWDNWYSWTGFYTYLDNHLSIDNWEYVANPSGGFLGLWWHFLKWRGYNVYLQIEQGNLCFKIGEVYDNHSSIRDEWVQIILQAANTEKHQEIHRPVRLGHGACMTVAVIDRKDWLGPDDSIADLDKVVSRLKEYERFLDRCVKNNN